MMPLNRRRAVHRFIERLRLLRMVMDERAEDSVVIGYECLIGSITLPDQDDRHALAAAIVTRADVVATCNLRDFLAEALDPYGIEARHPDEFVRHLIDLAPTVEVDTVREPQERLVNPPVGMADLLALFERVGLGESVVGLRRLMES
jgi:hypothetical protein